MNSSVYSADGATNLRILTAALLVNIAIVGFAISARVNSSPLQAFSAGLDNDVNRAAKANRAAVTAPAQLMQTISFQLHGLTATSVLVRMPVTREAQDSAPKPFLLKSGQPRLNGACEPMVSVLTEVAKQLQPGRCLT
jgi:hypothetical protein